jgi:hypothetical protein
MNSAELEHVYTALAECIARVGEARTSLLLATLTLDLLSEQPDAGAAIERLQRAEHLAQL